MRDDRDPSPWALRCAGVRRSVNQPEALRPLFTLTAPQCVHEAGVMTSEVCARFAYDMCFCAYDFHTEALFYPPQRTRTLGLVHTGCAHCSVSVLSNADCVMTTKYFQFLLRSGN